MMRLPIEARLGSTWAWCRDARGHAGWRSLKATSVHTANVLTIGVLGYKPSPRCLESDAKDRVRGPARRRLNSERFRSTTRTSRLFRASLSVHANRLLSGDALLVGILSDPSIGREGRKPMFDKAPRVHHAARWRGGGMAARGGIVLPINNETQASDGKRRQVRPQAQALALPACQTAT